MKTAALVFLVWCALSVPMAALWCWWRRGLPREGDLE